MEWGFHGWCWAGKTFVGIMLIERLVVQERKKYSFCLLNRLLRPFGKLNLQKYLPNLKGAFSNLAFIAILDLLREGETYEKLESVKEEAEVVIIDEAHHFRNEKRKGVIKDFLKL